MSKKRKSEPPKDTRAKQAPKARAAHSAPATKGIRPTAADVMPADPFSKKPLPTAAPLISVVIATYNRPAGIAALLADLEAQQLQRPSFEVIVVDDGSTEPAAAFLAGKPQPGSTRILRQANGGAAKARQAGAELAQGELLVFLDDDMRVGPDFLEAHAKLHTAPERRRVVLGHLRPDGDIDNKPVFERFYAMMLDRMKDRAADGHQPGGPDVYTGNMSVRRALFEQVGGFDTRFGLIEDAELGVRLQKAGAEFLLSADAWSVHASDHTDEQRWLARSIKDGKHWAKLGRKHADVPGASPWRFLGAVNPLSRPFLWLTVLSPESAGPVAKVVMRAAGAADSRGLKRAAIAGTTLAYGMQYFRGVREESGSLASALAEYMEFRNAWKTVSSGESGETLMRAVRIDHGALLQNQAKYGGGSSGSDRSLWSDAVQNIGFQTLLAYRVMRAFRAAGYPLAAKFCSRLIRHLYGSDIHWDANISPGVVFVHGFGLAISAGTRIESGAVIFQHVTLGIGRSKDGRNGSPHIGAGAHIGVGATIAGPIQVGSRCKVMAGCTITADVPDDTVVESPEPHLRARSKKRD